MLNCNILKAQENHIFEQLLVILFVDHLTNLPNQCMLAIFHIVLYVQSILKRLLVNAYNFLQL